MNLLKLYFIVLVIFTAIDLVWLGWLMRPFYMKHLAPFPLTNYLPGIIGVYLILALAPIIFVFWDATEATPLCELLTKAALLGFVIYGVYDFTNLAILKDWSFQMVVVDTIWGTVLYTATVFLSFYAGKFLGLFSNTP